MEEGSKQPHVIVIGAGFGGLAAAKALAGKPVCVTILDRKNHHLFQPLLYQVATAGLSPADIAQPIRTILNYADNIEISMSDVHSVDPTARIVHTSDGDFSYDYLIVATGARHSYFGHPEWEKFAPGLKEIDDALEIRRRLLTAFEVAEKTQDAAVRSAALTFVVVGGGPTGVEMAGAIAEIARFAMVKDFHHINPASARVILVEAAPRVLPSFDTALSGDALRELQRIRVDVRLDKSVKNVTEEGVEVEGEFIRARTIVWAAGNAASPLVKSLGVELDRAGRAKVTPTLSIPGHPEIFVIGDVANFSHQSAKPLPALSPVAMQQGRHAVENILALMRGSQTLPFDYIDKGSMATIGRNKAVADLGFIRFSGFFAWASWAFVHLFFLVGFQNRIAVFFQWAWAYVTFSRGARLITGGRDRHPPD